REVERSLTRARERQRRLAAAASRQAYQVTVKVGCTAGRPVGVELTYLTGGASWHPVYEARATPTGDRVELVTYATVTQATGEDWRNAQVALSTAVPRQDATPPEIQK